MAVRRHGRAYLLGLLSHTERKNSWSLAEFAGDVPPDGLQRLLSFSPWDEGACRDAVALAVTIVETVSKFRCPYDPGRFRCTAQTIAAVLCCCTPRKRTRTDDRKNPLTSWSYEDSNPGLLACHATNISS